jgi:hypothetical protein
MTVDMLANADFDSLRITAGSAHGLPSPGQTTLTRLGPPGSDWDVNGFFDISYEITFVGAPGGALDGLSGSTADTLRIRVGEPPRPVSALSDSGAAALAAILLVAGTALLLLRRVAIG